MAIVETATIAARRVAQVVTRSNANTFRYLPNYRIWLWAYPGPWAIHGLGRLFWLAHESPGPSTTVPNTDKDVQIWPIWPIGWTATYKPYKLVNDVVADQGKGDVDFLE
jgi:hypothetical protein